MKKQITGFLILIVIVLAVASCSSERRPMPQSGEVTITGLGDDHWTYFSFETGETVGTSPLSSAADDAGWAERTDWDIAICGEMIRTNGGTSGAGRGGILRNETTNFFNLTEAPTEGYTVDTDDVVVRR
ncbi:MAG: HmuY family protein [Tidjanibacter sp.]|nr:HmuY family protein [Tidjanibacter sp.]